MCDNQLQELCGTCASADAVWSTVWQRMRMLRMQPHSCKQTQLQANPAASKPVLPTAPPPTPTPAPSDPAHSPVKPPRMLVTMWEVKSGPKALTRPPVSWGPNTCTSPAVLLVSREWTMSAVKGADMDCTQRPGVEGGEQEGGLKGA
jgi:hypothetical protein